ncbi:MAG: DUF222 domain-containing protein [Algicola sp.]|nr:DUF222 domain-containing protein [Algicola sp.]
MDLNQPSIITLLNGKETIEYDEQLAGKITLLAAQINAATYLFLKLLGEFDRRAGWAGDGIRSCAHWLDWKCGIAGCAARERVRIAHCLDELPLINKAFEAGEVSYSKVRAMTRVATNDNEEYLLMIAQHGTASHIAKLVRKYRRVEKNMDLEQLEALQQSREFNYFQDDDGMWEIRARLPQDEGGLVIKAIDEIMRQQDKPLNKPLECVEKNVAAETNFSKPEPEIMETCNFPQKCTDAFCAMAEHYLASATDENPKTLAGHERCQVVLHLDVETLKHEHCCEHSGCNDQHLGPLHRPHSLGDQWIDPQNAKRLSCDASLLTVLEDEDGNVLNIASKTRTIPPMLKRALDVRDSTCKFPGCCESHYVDFHHIQHWGDLGETKKGNLIKLCRFHHRALHNGLFDIEAQGDENNPTFIFKTATGKVMEPNPKLPQTEKTTVTGAIKDFKRQWPNINTRTGRTLWQGEGMDYSMGVDSLLNRRNGPVDYK